MNEDLKKKHGKELTLDSGNILIMPNVLEFGFKVCIDRLDTVNKMRTVVDTLYHFGLLSNDELLIYKCNLDSYEELTGDTLACV